MKRRIIVEVHRADASWQDINHTHGHNLAVDEVLLVERAKTLGGDQWAFAEEPFELAGVALVQWVTVDHLRMRVNITINTIFHQPVDSSGRF